MGKNPKIDIPFNQYDKIMEAVAFLALLFCLLIPLYYWSALPEQMPTHFNSSGQPDAYGSKGSVWMLPAISLFVYLLMTFVGKEPSNFNFPGKITQENAASRYRDALYMIRFLKVGCLCLFAYMIYMGIQVGLKQATGFGEYFIFVFMLIILGPILYFAFKKK